MSYFFSKSKVSLYSNVSIYSGIEKQLWTYCVSAKYHWRKDDIMTKVRTDCSFKNAIDTFASVRVKLFKTLSVKGINYKGKRK